jgi:hypothetical protein
MKPPFPSVAKGYEGRTRPFKGKRLLVVLLNNCTRSEAKCFSRIQESQNAL